MIMYSKKKGQNLLKLLFGLIQLIDWTRPKFDVKPNRVKSTQSLVCLTMECSMFGLGLTERH